MAAKCGTCRSTDVQHLGEDNVCCLACGVTGTADRNLAVVAPEAAPAKPKKAASSK